jgi:hypothetical protein
VPDVIVSCSDVDEPETPTGPVLAGLRVGGTQLYSVHALASGYAIHYPGLCEFRVSADARRVSCLIGPECNEGLVAVLLTGTITAFLLVLRGYAVLHGSAVLWQGSTVVFVGPAGSGKTTVAALCCAAGAQLVNDDVIPLATSPDGVVCVGLASELRLRHAASTIVELFPTAPKTRGTPDGRLGLLAPEAQTESNTVSAVVLPRPTRGASHLTTRRLVPSLALEELLANVRVPGETGPPFQAKRFLTVADLAATVPVMEAEIPWGPPFRTDLVSQLFDAVVRPG